MKLRPNRGSRQREHLEYSFRHSGSDRKVYYINHLDHALGAPPRRQVADHFAAKIAASGREVRVMPYFDTFILIVYTQ